jgi:hypothetical protein
VSWRKTDTPHASRWHHGAVDEGGHRASRRRRTGRAVLAGVVALVVSLWSYPRLAAMSAHQEPLPLEPTTYTDGSYRFMSTQPGNDQVPVGYNPCKQILMRVNLQGAPPHAMDLVFHAIDDIRHASGLRIAYAGQTPDRPRYDVGRVGPVLVAWASASELRNLGGGVIGVGGSGSYSENYGQTKYFVSGVVTFDSEDFTHMSQAEQQAVVDHEFGHLVGLAHVPDKGEIMYPSLNPRQLQYGHGDLTGLAKLGELSCR